MVNWARYQNHPSNTPCNPTKLPEITRLEYFRTTLFRLVQRPITFHSVGQQYICNVPWCYSYHWPRYWEDEELSTFHRASQDSSYVIDFSMPLMLIESPRAPQSFSMNVCKTQTCYLLRFDLLVMVTADSLRRIQKIKWVLLSPILILSSFPLSHWATQSNKILLPLALFILQCKHALRGSHCLHSLQCSKFSSLSSQKERYYTLGRFIIHTAGWHLGGIDMVILCIDDYIASSILLLLTPNIKDCRYDHVIDSSTIIDCHVLLSHHENILLAGVLPISITNYDDQSKNDSYYDMLLS